MCKHPLSFKISLPECGNTVHHPFCHNNADDIPHLPKTFQQDGGWYLLHVLWNGGYNDIIETQKSFDMSLIIEAICDEGIYLPTKVADSIQGGLPVFCVSPLKGTQHDLVDLYEIGYFADNTNIDDIYVKLISRLEPEYK